MNGAKTAGEAIAGEGVMSSEHTKNKRRATKDKHDEGQRKKQMGAGGEKGDKRRKKQQRKRSRPQDEQER